MPLDKWLRKLEGFKTELAHYSWFKRVGKPESTLANPRVDFQWMVEHDAFRYSAWGESLVEVEDQIDRVIYDQAALQFRNDVAVELKLERIVGQRGLDTFFLGLDDAYGSAEDGQFPGTGLYPSEIAELPQRLVTYAALERCVLDEVQPSSILVMSMSILARGFWPAGFAGSRPNGTILVW